MERSKKRVSVNVGNGERVSVCGYTSQDLGSSQTIWAIGKCRNLSVGRIVRCVRRFE